MRTRLLVLSVSFVACLLASQHSAAVDTNTALSPTIPDVRIYDHHGRSLRFCSDLIRDRTVAINFIFTSCTTTCPPLTAAMRAIQRELGARVGRDIWLISVSVDPAVDRPERLGTFATTFGAGAAGPSSQAARPKSIAC